MSSLVDFIDIHKRKSGVSKNQTHTLFSEDRVRALVIKPEEQDTFFKLYNDYVQTHDEQDTQGCNSISEKIGDVFPFFLDIDFDVDWFETGIITRDQVEDALEQLLNFVRQLVSVTFDTATCDNVRILVSKRLFYKIHVHLPDLFVTKEQAVVLLGTIKLHMESLLSGKTVSVGAKLVRLWSKALDKSVYTTGLRMLHSHKGCVSKTDERQHHHQFFGEDEPYHITYAAVDASGQRLPPSLQNLKLFSIKCHNVVPCTIVNYDMLANENDIKAYDAQITKKSLSSSSPPATSNKSRSDTRGSSSDAMGNIEYQLDSLVINEQDGDGIDMDCAVLHELSTWIENAVLQTCGLNVKCDKNIRRLPNSRILSVPLGISECPFAKRMHSRSQRANPSSALYVLVTPLAATLRCWSTSCSGSSIKLDEIPEPLLHKLFGMSILDRLMDKALFIQTSEHVTELCFHLVKTSHAASPENARNTSFRWFAYSASQHRWVQEERIVKTIMSEEGTIQRSLQRYVTNLMEISKDDENRKKTTQTAFKKLSQDLQTWCYVNGTVLPLLGKKLHMYSQQEYGRPFADLLDKKPKLMGFTNGVFDFGTGEFRAGRSDDYITATTGIEYHDYLTFDPTVRHSLESALRCILPIEDEYHYMLWEMASCLNGSPVTQRFFILTGYGSNGKSTIVRLINLAFGDYAGEVDVTMFTKPRPSSNNAAEDLMALRGKRFVVCSEPNSKDTLNLGTLKWLSGCDRITARGLYGQQQSFYLQCTIFMLCNEIPQIPAPQDDHGTFRRLKPREFRNRFVVNPSKEGEVAIDPNINDKMESWKEAFMALLIRYHLLSDKDIPKCPQSFVQFEQVLRSNNRYYERFFKQCITLDKVETPVPCHHVFHLFRDWVKVHGFNCQVRYDEFVRQMVPLLGKDHNEAVLDEEGNKCWNIRIVNAVRY